MRAGLERLRIRSASNADRRAVDELMREVLAEYGLAGDSSAMDADLEDLQASYADRGGLFEVILDAEDAIVGSAGLYPLQGDTVELRKMYLHRRLRGQGWGKSLLHRMIAHARALGFTAIELETADALVEAVALYRAAGFQPMAPRASAPARCNQAYRASLASLRLDAVDLPQFEPVARKGQPK